MAIPPRNREGNRWIKSDSKAYDWLLEYNAVKDFADSFPNPKTRGDYLHALNVFFRSSEIAPDKFIELEPRDAKRLILKIVNQYRRENKISAARQIRTAAKYLYNQANEFEKIPLEFSQPQEKIPKRRKKVFTEHIPEKIEIYKMVDFWNKRAEDHPSLKAYRNRAMILTQFESGVRGGALTSLKVGMVKNHLYPEIKTPIPLKITNQVDRKLSEYSLDYYYCFVMTEECAGYLKDYLQIREENGGKLRDSDYLFAPVFRTAIYDFVKVNDYNLMIKYTAGKVGLDPQSIWSHLLRKSYRKILNATKELDEDTREAVMGHRLPGSRENYFDRHDLSEIIEKMKNCDFNRLTETDLIVEERLKNILKDRDEEIRRLRQQVERGPELDQLIKSKDDIIKLAKALEEYGFKIEKQR